MENRGGTDSPIPRFAGLDERIAFSLRSPRSQAKPTNPIGFGASGRETEEYVS